MKRFNASLFALVLFLIIALPVLASEGTAKLESTGGEMGSCFVASVYVDGRYRVLMTCRDLRSALDPVRNKYIAWAKNGENLKKIDEIENGKLQASLSDEFKEIVITVEESNRVNKPSGGVVLAGKMVSFEFDKAPHQLVQGEVVMTPTPTPTTMVEKTTSTTGNVFKALGKALLTGFAVLLIVVGILSYVSSRRRKN